VGWRIQQLRFELGEPEAEACDFQDTNGIRWTSNHFRHQYLYLFLTLQRIQGDAALAKNDGSPGMSIAEALWSFHCYRRYGCRHCSRKRSTNSRAKTKSEVAEHANGACRKAPWTCPCFIWSDPTRTNSFLPFFVFNIIDKVRSRGIGMRMEVCGA
jgi:3'-phosphoadenosine 5'-phosphosulfate sulfotransferase (PAPS reductase)/FAD synthetase